MNSSNNHQLTFSPYVAWALVPAVAATLENAVFALGASKNLWVLLPYLIIEATRAEARWKR